MSKIKSINLKRFKQLKEFDLDFDDTTVLIGSNNAGKSSVLQALHFAVAVAQTAKLVGEGVKWGQDKFELSFNPAQLLYSPVADVLTIAYGGILVESASQQIEIEIILTDGKSCQLAVRRGRNRNIQVSILGRLLGERLMDSNHPFTVYAPGLAGIAKEERYMSPGVVRRVVARGDANLVLRNVLLMIRDKEHRDRDSFRQTLEAEYQKAKELHKLGQGPEPETWYSKFRLFNGPWGQFQSDMQKLFPNISLEIDFDPDQDETINIFFRQNFGPRLPIEAAGTSILQASQILAYISLFKPEVLILDEPDSHLHPNNQRAFCNLVTQLTDTRGFRVLLSTHSRHVLDSLKERAKIVWMSGGKKVDYEVVSTPEMLLELGALDSVDYFANGQFTCLVATEDSDTDSIIALSALLESNNFAMKDVEVRPYSGCSKIESAKVLRAFLRDKAPKVKFILHRDRDYMPDPEVVRIEDGLRQIDAHPFITQGSDIENYYLNSAHIAELNPLVSVQRAQELIDAATLNTRQKSIKVLINIRTEAAIKNRNGGPAHNAGELAALSMSDYDSNPAKWRRGKLVLNELKSLLHQELKGNAILFKPSRHLASPELEALKKSIWPQARVVLQ